MFRKNIIFQFFSPIFTFLPASSIVFHFAEVNWTQNCSFVFVESASVVVASHLFEKCRNAKFHSIHLICTSISFEYSLGESKKQKIHLKCLCIESVESSEMNTSRVWYLQKRGREQRNIEAIDIIREQYRWLDVSTSAVNYFKPVVALRRPRTHCFNNKLPDSSPSHPDHRLIARRSSSTLYGNEFNSLDVAMEVYGVTYLRNRKEKREKERN